MEVRGPPGAPKGLLHAHTSITNFRAAGKDWVCAPATDSSLRSGLRFYPTNRLVVCTTVKQ